VALDPFRAITVSKPTLTLRPDADAEMLNWQALLSTTWGGNDIAPGGSGECLSTPRERHLLHPNRTVFALVMLFSAWPPGRSARPSSKEGIPLAPILNLAVALDSTACVCVTDFRHFGLSELEDLPLAYP
jgi:hypothetical protein